MNEALYAVPTDLRVIHVLCLRCELLRARAVTLIIPGIGCGVCAPVRWLGNRLGRAFAFKTET